MSSFGCGLRHVPVTIGAPLVFLYDGSYRGVVCGEPLSSRVSGSCSHGCGGLTAHLACQAPRVPHFRLAPGENILCAGAVSLCTICCWCITPVFQAAFFAPLVVSAVLKPPWKNALGPVCGVTSLVPRRSVKTQQHLAAFSSLL